MRCWLAVHASQPSRKGRRCWLTCHGSACSRLPRSESKARHESMGTPGAHLPDHARREERTQRQHEVGDHEEGLKGGVVPAGNQLKRASSGPWSLRRASCCSACHAHTIVLGMEQRKGTQPGPMPPANCPLGPHSPPKFPAPAHYSHASRPPGTRRGSAMKVCARGSRTWDLLAMQKTTVLRKVGATSNREAGEAPTDVRMQPSTHPPQPRFEHRVEVCH